jgi:two-component system, OmpR family, alkaline phosphatase synthesis response regulator PhoP
MNENNTKKILLVDDEPDILEFLEYNLKKEGYQVVTAADGLNALKQARETRPDLIILDIMMPGLDGIETCRQLRSEPQFNQTPIAFLTARDEDYTQIAALDIGGDDFITKPIKPKVFLSRIQALLRRAASEPSNEEKKIVIRDLIVDRSSYQITLKGLVHNLPKKEFEIIWLLASKPNRVFSRDEIYSQVWGDDVLVGQRTIDVHIRKIRERLGDDFIKTLKGVGYKFD